MAAYHNDLSQFRQLRDQAARKKQLEARRARLLPQCQDLAAQAEARKTERLEAEQELAGLESKGPWACSTPSPEERPSAWRRPRKPSAPPKRPNSRRCLPWQRLRPAWPRRSGSWRA